jgi:predicted transcriptional regulator
MDPTKKRKFDQLFAHWHVRLQQLAEARDYDAFQRLSLAIQEVAFSYVSEDALDDWYADLEAELKKHSGQDE